MVFVWYKDGAASWRMGNTMAEQEQRTETGAVSLQSIDLKGAVKIARNFFS